jgi:hypothetical protein
MNFARFLKHAGLDLCCYSRFIVTLFKSYWLRAMYVSCCVQFDVLNHMYVISMISFRHVYQMSWGVSGSCQPLCDVPWRFCSSWQSEFQNCSTQTGRNILCYGGKHGECSVCVCVCVHAQEEDFFSNTKKMKLSTLWWVAKWLTA